MATLTAPGISAGVQPKGLRVGLVAVTSIFSLAASFSTGDVIQMVKVPANARVVDLKVKPTCAGAGTGSFIVGDGVSTNRYIIETVMSASAGFTSINNQSFTPYTYSTDDTIDVTVSASATFSPATGSITMIAIFSMDASTNG